ncbi:MAG: alpha-N-arabinofuranosidase [Anaerolineae bacterium]|nr:alpha-N-arabinofuranosidase [Anaerolineae bacterium]
MIAIRPEVVIGRIEPNIYGMFIEHLGRCIYGGIFDEGSPLSDAEGYRKDVLKACQRLAPPVLRWPGGNFVSGYHWQDGVGPRDKRPRRFDLAWFEEESNRFGTDEFLGFCRRLNTQPYICANAGSGTIEEAAGWVEYCNGWTNTHYANRRRRHGNSVPFNVPYWGLGNEVYGSWQIGHLDAEDYAKKALEMAKVMRWTDPNVRLVACGLGREEWDLPVLERMRGQAEYLSVHCYVGSPDYYRNVCAVSAMEEILERTKASIRQVYEVEDAAQAPVKIAVDEWNVWYRARGNERFAAADKLREVYDLSDALCVATFVHLFQRECRTVTMANLAQMVNVIAPILTTPESILLQSIYYPLVLLRHHSGPLAVQVEAEGDCVPEERAGAVACPYLDVAASLSEDGRKLYLSVVNRHQTEDIEEPVQVKGAALGDVRAWELNGPDVHAVNTFECPEVVSAREVQASLGQGVYVFPAHSHTVMEVALH